MTPFKWDIGWLAYDSYKWMGVTRIKKYRFSTNGGLTPTRIMHHVGCGIYLEETYKNLLLSAVCLGLGVWMLRTAMRG